MPSSPRNVLCLVHDGGRSLDVTDGGPTPVPNGEPQSARPARRDPPRGVRPWITEHPGEPLGARHFAARARPSPRHFARAFRAETGVTPGRYVERVRVDHPRRLPAESGEGIAQIARGCGYGIPQALSRAFVGTLGRPPAEYRRRFGTSRP
ncbi:helix-turn-helix protein [Streptomyces sp. CG 926]|nr:helix-turn-helix domain-containing protein [Streptomyces sp. CG 926]PWK74511.1 helix-turn-helix protein [Streptomyces sp. CG 926]